MKPEQKKKLNDVFTTHPRASNREISVMTKLAPTTVGKYRKEFWGLIDKEFIEHSVKKSIFEMRRSVEHWHILIEKNYEIIETGKKPIIVHTTDDNGNPKTTIGELPLDPDSKRQILHEIAELEVKIQEWGNDPEISTVLKVMSSNEV